jgi:hypothetical protein
LIPDKSFLSGIKKVDGRTKVFINPLEGVRFPEGGETPITGVVSDKNIVVLVTGESMGEQEVSLR